MKCQHCDGTGDYPPPGYFAIPEDIAPDGKCQFCGGTGKLDLPDELLRLIRDAHEDFLYLKRLKAPYDQVTRQVTVFIKQLEKLIS